MKAELFLKVRFILLVLFAASLLSVLTSCRKKNTSESAENNTEQTEQENEGLDFYSPAEDNALWVETILARIEEERIAEELAKMEEDLSEYQLDEEELEVDEEASEEEEQLEEEEQESEEQNPIEKFCEEAAEGRVLNGKKQELSFYEFQNEILVPQQTEDGYIVIHSADSAVTRNFYNFEYQLVKKEEWKIKSASDTKLLKTEKFSYTEDTKKINKKDIVTPDSFETISYNENSSPINVKKYILKDEESFITLERSWFYNSDNKIIKDEQKEYSYKNNDYKNPPEVFVRRYEYIYYDNASDSKEKNEIPPDSKYYENNILKMQYNYTSEKGKWYSWVYFDETFSVKTCYEDDVRISEEYYNSGKLIRKKTYDKMD